jgi:hypothetical protein
MRVGAFLLAAVLPTLGGCAESTVKSNDANAEEAVLPEVTPEIVDVQIDIELVGDIVDAEDAVPDPGRDGPSPIGGSCATAGDCEAPEGMEPLCVLDFGGMITLPNGYCSAICEGVDPSECGPGAGCLYVEVLPELILAYCLATCSTSEECRVEEGYICTDWPPIIVDFYCLPNF